MMPLLGAYDDSEAAAAAVELSPRLRQIALHAAHVLTEHSVRELQGVFANNDCVFADRERLIDEARD